VAAAAGSEKEAAAHAGARRADRDRVCHLWGFPLSRIGVGAAAWCLGRGTQRRFAVSRIVRTCACLRMATSTTVDHSWDAEVAALVAAIEHELPLLAAIDVTGAQATTV